MAGRQIKTSRVEHAGTIETAAPGQRRLPRPVGQRRRKPPGSQKLAGRACAHPQPHIAQERALHSLLEGVLPGFIFRIKNPIPHRSQRPEREAQQPPTHPGSAEDLQHPRQGHQKDQAPNFNPMPPQTRPVLRHRRQHQEQKPRPNPPVAPSRNQKEHGRDEKPGTHPARNASNARGPFTIQGAHRRCGIRVSRGVGRNGATPKEAKSQQPRPAITAEQTSWMKRRPEQNHGSHQNKGFLPRDPKRHRPCRASRDHPRTRREAGEAKLGSEPHGECCQEQSDIIGSAQQRSMRNQGAHGEKERERRRTPKGGRGTSTPQPEQYAGPQSEQRSDQRARQIKLLPTKDAEMIWVEAKEETVDGFFQPEHQGVQGKRLRHNGRSFSTRPGDCFGKGRFEPSDSDESGITAGIREVDGMVHEDLTHIMATGGDGQAGTEKNPETRFQWGAIFQRGRGLSTLISRRLTPPPSRRSSHRLWTRKKRPPITGATSVRVREKNVVTASRPN